MKVIICLTLLLTSFATSSKEQLVPNGPAIKDYGPTYAIADSDVKLPKDHIYKAVFDIVEAPDGHSAHNRSIESIARFINMHVRNGVKPENIELAAVFHGPATKNTLSDKAYQQRYQSKNPNSKLLQQLADFGVKFYLCGQSAFFSGIDKNELNRDIKLGLSAMTMFVLLQDEGYNLIP